MCITQFTWKVELGSSYNTYRYSWRVQAGFVQISCQAVGHCIATNCVLTFFFLENENIFNHICTNDFVPKCNLSDTKYSKYFFRKLSSINILKKKIYVRQYIWFYYTFFKNKTTEFGSNCYICPEGLYDKVLCIFSLGVLLVF